MKVLIVYDSVFGNTERIAQAMGKALGSQEDVTLLRVSAARPEQLMRSDLIIAGSPTRGFRPTPAMKELLQRIPKHGLKGIQVAAFDTRISVSDADSRILPPLVKLFGYAAEPIANRLKKKGGELVIPPEGFIVEGSEGPIKEGELERAADWARQIITAHVTAHAMAH